MVQYCQEHIRLPKEQTVVKDFDAGIVIPILRMFKMMVKWYI